MALRQKDLTAASLQTGLGADKINPAKSAETVCVTENSPEANDVVDTDAQEEELWQQAFATSPDTLSRLAARSRAHREAGRTKKVSA